MCEACMINAGPMECQSSGSRCLMLQLLIGLHEQLALAHCLRGHDNALRSQQVCVYCKQVACLYAMGQAAGSSKGSHLVQFMMVRQR
jgi:hypothetical protein